MGEFLMATLNVEDVSVVTFKDILAVQWKGWLLMLSTLSPILIGFLVQGTAFFSHPLPVPDVASTIWFAINGFLCFIGSALTLRTIWLFRTMWTRQEIWILRGAFYLTIGGGMGYWTRAFLQDAHMTIGTPYLTAGCLCVVYGMWRLPERFVSQRRGSIT